MHDGAKRSLLPRRGPAKEVHLENLHAADISRLITSDSRQAGGRAGGQEAGAQPRSQTSREARWTLTYMYLVDWWPGYDMRFKLLKRPTFLPVVRAEKAE